MLVASVSTPSSNWNTPLQEEEETQPRQSNQHHRQAIFVMNYVARTTTTSLLLTTPSHEPSEPSDVNSRKSIYWEGSDPTLICCFVLKGVLSFLSSTLARSTAISTHHVNNVLYWDGFIKQYFMRGTIEGTDHDDALCGSGYESLTQISEALWKDGGIMHSLLLASVVYCKRVTSSSTADYKVLSSTRQSSSNHYAGQEQEQHQVPNATRHLSCLEAYDDALNGLRTATTTTTNNNGRRGSDNDVNGYHVGDENSHAIDNNNDFGTDWDGIQKNNEDKVESLRALQSAVDLLQVWVNDDAGSTELSHCFNIVIVVSSNILLPLLSIYYF